MTDDTPHKKHTHGGARAGAGRPRLGKTRLDATLTLCVSKALHAHCKAAGNQRVREILAAHFEDEATAAPLTPPNEMAFHDRNDTAPASLRAWRLAPEARTITQWEMRAACGFPSPALDYAHEELNLNDFLLRHPLSSFIVQTQGDSMVDAGIYEGDLVIVDRAIEPRSGSLVLAYIDGEFTIKELRIQNGLPELHAKNLEANYPVLRPKDLDSFSIEGVLVGVVRRL